MAAARALRIPYVIHESNSVPGRSNKMFAPAAKSFTCTFHKTVSLIPYAIRTGQPIRRELRDVAGHRRRPTSPYVLGLGGSQGSQFINQVLPAAGSHFGVETEVLLATGRDNFDKVKGAPPNVKLAPYLETAELVEAYRWATVAVARSGGTVAEFALFGIPSVLIPLPSAADNHQFFNALEFVSFGGATLLEQKDATPENLAEAIDAWHADPERAAKAREALHAWDAADATARIAGLVRKAAETS
jgi:UDP-N-acetylglucosamine--N-acetylmuramyl-(pentapeptide) pyrophosphoryl-undecaprenol N-acetylglucosamine transferase